MKRLIGLIMAASLTAACATSPEGGTDRETRTRHAAHTDVAMGHPQPTPASRRPAERPPENETPGEPGSGVQAAPAPAAFATLPGWSEAEIYPGVMALKKSCRVFREGAADAPVSSVAPWAGQTMDWLPACAALEVVQDEASARTVMQALFRPVEINSPNGESRFTGYFEPVYEARTTPEPPFTEPVPAYPRDLERESGVGIFQRLPNGSRRPYPDRAAITAAGVEPLAYAHPADVFFLQIQGSGKLVFPDGSVLKAVYASHNGHRFGSTANWLLERGWISRGEASMQGIRAWMDRATPEQVRAAMNANPRYIFFTLEEPEDGDTGPKGAMGVPLTPLGSVAIDRDHNPMGVPMFIQTTAPGLGGDWSGLLVAQDTGGAVNGPVRGDIYFGTGKEAGERAGTMNAPGRLWVLLPRAVADQIPGIDAFADLGRGPAAP
ncbi:murein transglycosylase A [Henriciella marina]|uniref:murein transglycosylase A n=1 Tax=Henriciella marina TaxID=453851 RepID=UPI00035C7D6A|nr:MltA domain-containing protein [Henriciella marina]